MVGWLTRLSLVEGYISNHSIEKVWESVLYHNVTLSDINKTKCVYKDKNF